MKFTKTNLFLIIAGTAVGVVLIALLSLPYVDTYDYHSNFQNGDLGPFAVADPAMGSGSFGIENGMLKIVCNATHYNGSEGPRFQIGIGAIWKDPAVGGIGGATLWLPVYMKASIDVELYEPEGVKFPTMFQIENWINIGNGESYSASLIYDGSTGVLEYAFGSVNVLYPVTYLVPIATVIVPNDFKVHTDIDYRAERFNIVWAGHSYSEPLAVEPYVATNQQLTHFQFILHTPGTLYVKSVNIHYWDRLWI